MCVFKFKNYFSVLILLSAKIVFCLALNQWAHKVLPNSTYLGKKKQTKRREEKGIEMKKIGEEKRRNEKLLFLKNLLCIRCHIISVKFPQDFIK